jgi:hypothetical protein
VQDARRSTSNRRYRFCEKELVLDHMTLSFH